MWNEEIGRDFVELKRAFIEGGIQVFPDFRVGDPFILTTDWSRAKRILQESCPKSRTDRKDSLDFGKERVTSTKETIRVTKLQEVETCIKLLPI